MTNKKQSQLERELKEEIKECEQLSTEAFEYYIKNLTHSEEVKRNIAISLGVRALYKQNQAIIGYLKLQNLKGGQQ